MPRISIITPAYQAEKFIQRYIDSVLNFTHKNLQLILVNDASKDRTHEIIEANRKRIEDAGIDFMYINLTENGGQANAVDIALKYVDGEYLSWQDVDDIYFPECLSRSLQIMQENPECKLVLSKSLNVVADDDGELEYMGAKFRSAGYLPWKDKKHKNLLKDYFFDKYVTWGPMRLAESKALFEVLKDKSIFVSRGGQNAQLLFPMVYKYRWIYTTEILTWCLINADSHSHSKSKSYYRKMRKELYAETVKRIAEMPYYKRFYYLMLIEISNLNNIWRDAGIFKLNVKIRHKTAKLIIFKRVIFDWDFNKKGCVIKDD